VLDQPRDLAGADTGLAAAGTGQHQAGLSDTGDGLLLRGIEIFEVQGC